MAGKDNTSASQIDKTSFFWVGQCGACHPGGGPGEYDRDGMPYFDVESGLYGYELLGKTEADVTLDGDYTFLNPSTGAISAAPWHKTGVSEADCMLCHRAGRAIDEGKDMTSFWRQTTLRSMAALEQPDGTPVPAYAAAPTVGQGWHKDFALAPAIPGKPPKAATLAIDYGVGLADGSLIEVDGELRIPETAIAKTPSDQACWGCHGTPDLKKRGRVWFKPEQDVHYAGFSDTSLADHAENSTACSRCHPSGMSHEFAKGNAFVGSVRDGIDFEGFRSCRECHVEGQAGRDPEAPMMPQDEVIHFVPGHDKLSCQACHIPFKEDPAALVLDNAVTGSSVSYNTSAFLSGDPLDPTNPNRDRWYPAFLWKTDSDGVERLFPAKYLSSMWWGDWEDNGTRTDTTDDVIQPIALWRVRQMTAGGPLPVVTDDNGDGKPEVNRPEEILAYIADLRTLVDSYGNPIAANPVLVKGGKLWYEEAPGQIATIELHGSGIHAESGIPFSLDHNVRPASEAISWCGECHMNFSGGTPTPVFDRKVLIDPFDENGEPVYTTPREMTGANPY